MDDMKSPAPRAREIAEDELRSRMIRVARLVHGERWNDFGCWHGDLLSCGPCSRVAAALTEPPGRGPETGPDVETMRSELSRSYAVLMEAEAGIVETLDALTERPASQPMGPTFTRCRRCGGRGTVISDVKHGVACWFKNVAGQIERLQSLFAVGTAKTTPGSEAPATPAPDGPDGEPR